MSGSLPRRVGVLALQGDVAEHERALREAGAYEVWPVRLPADLDRVDFLVMPGGESTTIGRLMREYGVDAAVKRRAEQGMPIFGTCAGMILLATEIIGSEQPRLGLLPAAVRRNAYGRQVDSFETVLSAPEVSDRPIDAVFIRAPYIEAVGSGTRVLAEWDGHPVLVRNGRILAASFHPELTRDRRLHRYFLDFGADG